MAGLGFGAFFIGMLAFWAVTMVFWITTIIEVAKIPDHQYRAAGTDKVAWVLVVALCGFIGALIWRYAKRPDVLAAAGYAPMPPPGWYPDHYGQMRWWDGRQWTAAAGPPVR